VSEAAPAGEAVGGAAPASAVEPAPPDSAACLQALPAFAADCAVSLDRISLTLPRTVEAQPTAAQADAVLQGLASAGLLVPK
jgi:hypothetical protein